MHHSVTTMSFNAIQDPPYSYSESSLKFQHASMITFLQVSSQTLAHRLHKSLLHLFVTQFLTLQGLSTANSLHSYYGTAQLQGNEYMRVTHEKLTCIQLINARVFTSLGLARIKACARLQLIAMQLQRSHPQVHSEEGNRKVFCHLGKFHTFCVHIMYIHIVNFHLAQSMASRNWN